MLTSPFATYVPGENCSRDFKFGSSSFNGDGVIQQSVVKGKKRMKERKKQTED